MARGSRPRKVATARRRVAARETYGRVMLAAKAALLALADTYSAKLRISELGGGFLIIEKQRALQAKTRADLAAKQGKLAERQQREKSDHAFDLVSGTTSGT